jgi:AhpD family alkylhydroperoxidase
MARLPYADISQSATQPLIDRIAAQRGSVLHLYRMLLHSPSVTDGWLRYLTAIRHDCALPGGLRELIIMRVAGLNGAPYEAEQHAPIALKEGVTPAQLDALGRWETSEQFDAVQRAVLGLTDVMTRDIHVSDEIFAAVAAELGEPRLVVETVATIAAYNMVSRFLEALQISSQDLV